MCIRDSILAELLDGADEIVDLGDADALQRQRGRGGALPHLARQAHHGLRELAGYRPHPHHADAQREHQRDEQCGVQLGGKAQ